MKINFNQLETESLIDSLIKELAEKYGKRPEQLESAKLALKHAIKAYITEDKNQVAQKFYANIDYLIQAEKNNDKDNYNKIQCKKKCSHCCSIEVSITDEEADLLLKVAKDKNIKINTKRLKRQASHFSENWHKLGPKDMKCVFLKEKECSIYDYRPSVCRTYFVTNEQMLCDTFKANHKIKTWMPISVAILEIAIMLCGNGGSMAKKLLERIKRDK